MRFLRALQQRTAFLCVGALVSLGLAGGLAGCGSIEPVAPADAPITDPTQLYMKLTLDHPAVTLSTAASYHTLQLTATPRDALGTPMTGLSAPTYTSSDTTSVTVTADGLVTALQTTQGVNVIARLQVGPVTHADTAVINVTSLTPPPELASLSIHPIPPDSAMLGMKANDLEANINDLFYDLVFSSFNRIPTILPRVVDATGAAMSELTFEYASLDPAIATVERRSGIMQLIRPGQVRMVARTTAYGITKADTVTYTITLPLIDRFYIKPGPTGAPVFAENEVRIRPSGLVIWASDLGESVDVIFDDPTNVVMPPADGCDFMLRFVDAGPSIPGPLPSGSSCGVGNVLVTPSRDSDGDGYPYLPSVQIRQFPVPGVYPFHSTRLGASGQVIVTSDPAALLTRSHGSY